MSCNPPEHLDPVEEPSPMGWSQEAEDAVLQMIALGNLQPVPQHTRP